MSSQLRPGATGLNRVLLEKEAALKAFLGELLNGPEGYNESNSIPQGPPKPMRGLLEGAESIGPAPPHDSRYGGGGFGLESFAPLLGAATTGRLPNEPAPRSAPTDTTGMELPPAFTGGQEPINNGNIPPEIMAIVDNFLASQGGNQSPTSAPGMPSRGSILAQERPARPMMNARSSFVGPPQPKPFMGPPIPEEDEESPVNLTGLMGGGNNFANREPGIPSMMEDIIAGDSSEEEDLYEDPATEAYLSNLRQRPQHDDFEGSKARRIISGIMKGLLGGDFGIGDAPHQKALRSWRDKGTGLKEASDIEQVDIKERRYRSKNAGDLMYKTQKLLTEYNQKKRRLEEVDIPDMERKKLKDDLDNEYKTNLLELRKTLGSEALNIRRGKLAVDQRNANMNERRTKVMESNAEGGGRVSAREQELIHNEALRRVKNDPRYGKYWDEDDKDFNDIPMLTRGGKIRYDKAGNVEVKEKLDDITRKAIAAAIVKEEEIVAERKRNSYRPSGFVSPFDTPDNPFKGILNNE